MPGHILAQPRRPSGASPWIAMRRCAYTLGANSRQRGKTESCYGCGGEFWISWRISPDLRLGLRSRADETELPEGRRGDAGGDLRPPVGRLLPKAGPAAAQH